MLNFADRSKLEASEEQRFIESCQSEFIEKSLAATNARKVRTLTAVSFLPNVISAVTAGFFVVFLLSGYPRHIAFILGALLLCVVAAVELGKRFLITGIAKEFFVMRKVAAAAVVALCVLITVSMVASYQGGKQLITETGKEPDKSVNPEIAPLQAQLADQQETIKRLQRTTWKGKITVDASKGIVQAKKIEASLVERITALQSADDTTHAGVLAKSSAQKLNFGYLLGALGALADMFLLGLLWTSQRLKFEVASVHYSPHASSSSSTRYLTGRGSVEMPPPSMNQAAKERRPIGFLRNKEPVEDDDDKSSNDSPSNDLPSNDSSYNDSPLPEKEVVTITEKEVVELTDRVKTCAHCGERFVYYNAKAKYCSDQCRIAAWEGRTGKTWRKNQNH